MVKTLAALKAQAASDLPDNVGGQISPSDVRQLIVDFLDTFTPAYGAMSITSAGGVLKTLNITPAIPLSWETISPDTTSEYTCDPSSGLVSRPGLTANRVNLNMEVYAAAGRLVTVQLYNGGNPTPWRFTALGQGVAKPTSVSLTAVMRASTFALQVFLSADANGTDVTFKNSVIYVATVPVIG